MGWWESFFGGEFWLTRLLLQRGIALIYLVVFLNAAFQFVPLLGERGLLPVSWWLKKSGGAAVVNSPSIFQVYFSDWFAQVLAWAGVLLACWALTGLSEKFGLTVSMATWVALYVLYLSFVNVGQVFYAFGWESILLEAGFFAIFLGPANMAPSAAVIWMFRWLLFRIMLGAGLIKLRADPCWLDLTCLFYHYETQPIPGPLSWYYHHFPGVVHKLGVVFNHWVELIVPWGLFFPRGVAAAAGAFVIIFQAILITSGNLSWLNWLTLIIAFSAFDDRVWQMLFSFSPPALSAGPGWLSQVIMVLSVGVVVLSILPIMNMISPRQAMNAVFNPFHLVGTYGAFGGVTKERYEIIFEGTRDQPTDPAAKWHVYEFRGKPGDVGRWPPQIAPYHLRLDWLTWFAAFSPEPRDVWLVRLVEKLLEGNRNVTRLLRHNPFPDAPPTYVRAWYFRYRFSTPEERKTTGQVWQRELMSEYLPPMSLAHPLFKQVERQLKGE